MYKRQIPGTVEAAPDANSPTAPTISPFNNLSIPNAAPASNPTPGIFFATALPAPFATALPAPLVAAPPADFVNAVPILTIAPPY